MAENKPSGVVYVEPNRLLFYSSSINKVLFQDFPPDTVSDLDIINKEKFNQILTFFIQNALQKAIYDIALVFSQQTTFEKVLVPTISKDIDALTAEFTSMVPFEEVINRVYKENKNIKAYAINRVVYEHIRDCFTKNGSIVTCVLPASIILEKSPELANKLDLPTIASKAEALKAYNMIDSSFSIASTDQTVATTKNKNRTYILLGVFFLLLIIMLVFGYSTFFAKPPKTKTVNQPVKVAPTIQKEPVDQQNLIPSPKSATPSSNVSTPSALSPQK